MFILPYIVIQKNTFYKTIFLNLRNHNRGRDYQSIQYVGLLVTRQYFM